MSENSKIRGGAATEAVVIRTSKKWPAWGKRGPVPMVGGVNDGRHEKYYIRVFSCLGSTDEKRRKETA